MLRTKGLLGGPKQLVLALLLPLSAVGMANEAAPYPPPKGMSVSPMPSTTFRSVEHINLVVAYLRPGQMNGEPTSKSALFTADMKTQVTPWMDLPYDRQSRFNTAVLIPGRVFVHYRDGRDPTQVVGRWYEVRSNGQLDSNSVPWKGDICSVRLDASRRYVVRENGRWVMLDESLRPIDSAADTSHLAEAPGCQQLDSDHLLFGKVVTTGPELVAIGRWKSESSYWQASDRSKRLRVISLDIGRVLLLGEEGLLAPNREWRETKVAALPPRGPTSNDHGIGHLQMLIARDSNGLWMVMDRDGRIVADQLAHADLIDLAQDNERRVDGKAVLIQHLNGEWAVLQRSLDYAMVGWSADSAEAARAAAIDHRNRRVQEFLAMLTRMDSQIEARQRAEAEWRRQREAQAAALYAQRAADLQKRVQAQAAVYRALIDQIDKAVRSGNVRQAQQWVRDIDESVMMQVDRSAWLRHLVKWSQACLELSRRKQTDFRFSASRAEGGDANWGLELLRILSRHAHEDIIGSVDRKALTSQLMGAAVAEKARLDEQLANEAGIAALRAAFSPVAGRTGPHTPPPGYSMPTAPRITADQHFRWKYEQGRTPPPGGW